ncbi:hypothetical protein DV096_06655 [Bradymonadaceae bacterium TMQ3]|uniref:Twin-arginine translocation signal domain-containing protein n=1 Tax=Lujinxingia sediminis TaxID=2480984 RepID=A0ABY0CQA5_9DELT|nr:high-potential iron-sulfur protein [Lujinxingia sediminis]RDV38494.1 hypothetical protein DV096_06655 [Bradymonadaceae bacterium TMQ3]RVU42653.1 twin-arginine translocation signal domain-containing protein [Lujinxingia sediminis]TXC76889.1 twin-arginine translocation signal domain-containing protein [Bradymonadales bacterium TMQ1]
MSEKTLLNRRQFLERAAILGALATGAGTFLAACEPSGQSQATGSTRKGQAGTEASAVSCDDTSGLNEAQIATRTTNGYVEKTSKPDQRCDNCALYTKPEAGADCGGCTVVAGPINPGGWCRIWAPAA